MPLGTADKSEEIVPAVPKGTENDSKLFYSKASTSR